MTDLIKQAFPFQKPTSTRIRNITRMDRALGSSPKRGKMLWRNWTTSKQSQYGKYSSNTLITLSRTSMPNTWQNE